MATQAAMLACLVWGLAGGWAPAEARQEMAYVPRLANPQLDSLEATDRAQAQAAQAVTDSIRGLQSDQDETAERQARDLVIDFADVERPASAEQFRTSFHFPPRGQYLTGDCWAFGNTSFFESEIARLTGRRIKLSEMYTVYFEYLEKARRFVRERGDSYFGDGADGSVVKLVWQRHGVVPEDAYTGSLRQDGQHDHSRMLEEMTAYLDYVSASGLWDEDLVLASLRLIMDRYMGRPPETIVFEGRSLSPQQFLGQVLRLDLDRYVSVVSTLSRPFCQFGEFESQYNWWKGEDHYNVPLDLFCEVARRGLADGGTARLTVDVTDPGYSWDQNIAVVPEADLPPDHITQEARELRIHDESTADDHDVHAVGIAQVDGHDWFLIKDSYDLFRGGPPDYVMMRDDYLRLKVLGCLVHEDALRAVVPQFAPAHPAPRPAAIAPP